MGNLILLESKLATFYTMPNTQIRVFILCTYFIRQYIVKFYKTQFYIASIQQKSCRFRGILQEAGGNGLSIPGRRQSECHFDSLVKLQE
jgi:hypothetical protein